MEKEERIKQLKTLSGHLLSKYNLNQHDCSHIGFIIKPQDIVDIVVNQKKENKKEMIF